MVLCYEAQTDSHSLREFLWVRGWRETSLSRRQLSGEQSWALCLWGRGEDDGDTLSTVCRYAPPPACLVRRKQSQRWYKNKLAYDFELELLGVFQPHRDGLPGVKGDPQLRLALVPRSIYLKTPLPMPPNILVSTKHI